MEFKEIMKKNILLLTIAIIFSLIIQISVSAKEIRFVQVTDTHYSSDNDFSKRVLEATINDINNLNDVSFVVFTGDNIDKPNPEYLRDFIRKANKLKNLITSFSEITMCIEAAECLNNSTWRL